MRARKQVTRLDWLTQQRVAHDNCESPGGVAPPAGDPVHLEKTKELLRTDM